MLRKVVKVWLYLTSEQQSRQSIQYPQKVKVEGNTVKFARLVGNIKAKIHRPIEGTIKTVTVSQEPSGKYYPSILTEIEGENPKTSTEGIIIGVDLGLNYFSITSDGSKV